MFRVVSLFGYYTQLRILIQYKVGVQLISHSINFVLIHPVLLNYIETQTKYANTTH
jgi:hypothetical protein